MAELSSLVAKIKSNEVKKSLNNEIQTSVRGRGGHIKPPAPFPKRITLDLSNHQFRYWGILCFEEGIKKNEGLRVLLELLEEDEDFYNIFISRLRIGKPD